VVDYLRLADCSWPLLGRLMRGHAVVYRATGGRIGERLPGLPPVLLLDHVGARSGRKRTTALIYMPDGDAFVVVGAKGGYPRHPAWVHNLRANPDADVQVGSARIAVRSSEADENERRQLWPRAVAYNPFWGRYQERTERTVPLVILRRR
jgi:deazaflavin-dependent oxidoreductase (nitroreductase family)